MEPVCKSIIVKTSVQRAFEVFTEGFDTWWPKSHHIGTSPMKKAIIEGWVGGRCFGEQEDGTHCSWGSILVWEPPHRFVMAWQVTPAWKVEPLLEKSSEVEIRFIELEKSLTRVELEHRYFERHGEGFESMREMVNSEGGWGTLLALYRDRTAA